MSHQLEFFTIPSPCRGICQNNERGFCLGCMRSRAERFDWRNMEDEQKRNVLRLCRQRFLRYQRVDKQKSADEDNIQPSLPF